MDNKLIGMIMKRQIRTPNCITDIQVGDEILVKGRKCFFPVGHINPIRYEIPNKNSGIDSWAVWKFSDIRKVKKRKGTK